MRVNERRAEVARLFAQGLTQIEIAEKLGIGTGPAGRMVVSRDLKAIQRGWKDSAIRDFDTEKGRILNELHKVKSAAWGAWTASKAGRLLSKEKRAQLVLERKSRLRKVHSSTELEATVPVKEERETRTEGRSGDSRFLNSVMDTIREEMRLLGLAPPAGELSTSPPMVAFVVHAPVKQSPATTIEPT